MKTCFTLNGREVEVDAPPLRRLLDLVRSDLALPGTKEGCGEGECGACSVLLDGRVVCACLVPVFQLEGRSVVTVEGLEKDGTLDRAQRVLAEGRGVQCGACTPGMAVAIRAIYDREPSPSREFVREALAGNLCRCTGYEGIIAAVAAEPEVEG